MVYSKIQIIEFFLEYSINPNENFAWTKDLKSVAEKLTQFELKNEMPKSLPGIQFVMRATGTFMHKFYIPMLKKHLHGYHQSPSKPLPGRELEFALFRAKTEFESQIGVVPMGEGYSHQLYMVSVWESQEMATVVGLLRRWFNLALRLHYVLSYYSSARGFIHSNKLLAPSLYCEEIIPYIVLWAEYLLGSFFPCKPKHNSRVAIDTGTSFLFHACIRADFDRLRLHQNGYVSWNPFNESKDFPPLYLKIQDLMKSRQPWKDSIDYKAIAFQITKAHVRKLDIRGCYMFLRDLYALGSNRIGTLFNACIIEYIGEVVHQNATTKKNYNVFNDSTLNTYKEFARQVGDLLQSDAVISIWNALNLYVTVRHSWPEKLIGKLTQFANQLILDPAFVYCVVKELYTSYRHVLYTQDPETKNRIPNVDLFRYIGDIYVFIALVGGFKARIAVVGLLKFFIADLEATTKASVVPSPEEKLRIERALTYDTNVLQFNYISYEGAPTELDYYLHDSITKIELVGAVDGSLVLENCLHLKEHIDTNK